MDIDKDAFGQPSFFSGDIAIRSSIEYRHKKDDFFPTEELGENSDIIKEILSISEYRRVGWFDVVLSKRMYSKANFLAIAEFDLLGKIGKKLGYVKICTMYKHGDKYILYIQNIYNLA